MLVFKCILSYYCNIESMYMNMCVCVFCIYMYVLILTQGVCRRGFGAEDSNMQLLMIQSEVFQLVHL